MIRLSLMLVVVPFPGKLNQYQIFRYLENCEINPAFFHRLKRNVVSHTWQPGSPTGPSFLAAARVRSSGGSGFAQKVTCHQYSTVPRAKRPDGTLDITPKF